MIFGPLFDEIGRKLCRNAFDLDHYTIVKIIQPNFPNLDFTESLDFNHIKELRKFIEQRNGKKKKKVEEERRQDVNDTSLNPLRAAAVSGDLNGIKEWAKGYSVNARGGYGEPSILIDAVQANFSIDAIKLLIQLGAFINSVDDKLRTALHHACEIGSYDVVKLLLNKGAHYFLRDSLGRTAFHIVAAHTSAKCLALVLQHTKGCEEINDGDNEGMTPLHWTVAKNHTDHLDIMLSKKYRLDLRRTDIEGKTALHWCANNMMEIGKYEQSSAYKILNACNWGILNVKDIDGRTTLHLACGENNIGLVHLLASHSACDINAQDDMKRTALHWAAVAGYSNIVEALLKYNADDSLSDATKATALHYAASKNHIKCVIILTEGRNYAYLPDAEGRTPIVWAILKGHVQTMKVLLDKGAEVETKDFQKCTPLHAAASSGNTMCASLLLQSGCEIDSADIFSRTALFKTIENGHAETAALLIQKGSNCSIADDDGRRPIHFSAMFGHLNVLSLLLASGSDANSKDLTGKTPLHCAAYNGNLEAISFLVKSNANPDIRDFDGITALHWACGARQAASVELLLELGANPNMIDFSPDSDHCTPLDYAISAGCHESAQFVRNFRGLTGAELVRKSAVTIEKCWRDYKKNSTVQPQFNKPAKVIRRGSLMHRLSFVQMPEPIIEDSQDSLDVYAAPETPTITVPTNLNVVRRHSKVGLIVNGLNSFLEQNIFNEDDFSISAKMSAACKIQKAWKRYCTKIETNFLIQVMGSEEASSMVEKIIAKESEREMKRLMHDRNRRKSRRGSDASKFLFEFPSKISVDSRRSSATFMKTDHHAINPFLSAEESPDSGPVSRRASLIDFSRNRPRNETLEVNTLNVDKPLSRTPTIFKITMSEDELAYLAMEHEQRLENN